MYIIFQTKIIHRSVSFKNVNQKLEVNVNVKNLNLFMEWNCHPFLDLLLLLGLLSRLELLRLLRLLQPLLTLDE